MTVHVAGDGGSFADYKASAFITSISPRVDHDRPRGVRAQLLELRDRVAVLDSVEDPDSDAGCAAAEVLAIHNRLVVGGDGGDDAA